jgi:hypothetical protein
VTKTKIIVIFFSFAKLWPLLCNRSQVTTITEFDCKLSSRGIKLGNSLELIFAWDHKSLNSVDVKSARVS